MGDAPTQNRAHPCPCPKKDLEGGEPPAIHLQPPSLHSEPLSVQSKEPSLRSCPSERPCPSKDPSIRSGAGALPGSQQPSCHSQQPSLHSQQPSTEVAAVPGSKEPSMASCPASCPASQQASAHSALPVPSKEAQDAASMMSAELVARSVEQSESQIKKPPCSCSKTRPPSRGVTDTPVPALVVEPASTEGSAKSCHSQQPSAHSQQPSLRSCPSERPCPSKDPSVRSGALSPGAPGSQQPSVHSQQPSIKSCPSERPCPSKDPSIRSGAGAEAALAVNPEAQSIASQMSHELVQRSMEHVAAGEPNPKCICPKTGEQPPGVPSVHSKQPSEHSQQPSLRSCPSERPCPSKDPSIRSGAGALPGSQQPSLHSQQPSTEVAAVPGSKEPSMASCPASCPASQQASAHSALPVPSKEAQDAASMMSAELVARSVEQSESQIKKPPCSCSKTRPPSRGVTDTPVPALVVEPASTEGSAKSCHSQQPSAHSQQPSLRSCPSERPCPSKDPSVRSGALSPRAPGASAEALETASQVSAELVSKSVEKSEASAAAAPQERKIPCSCPPKSR